MPKIEELTYAFKNGKLEKCEPPAWFKKVIASGDFDWKASLSRAGARPIESFGKIDTLTVYRTPEDGRYLVEYVDVEEMVACVFIDNGGDYVLFRAQYVAPLVALILEAERQDTADQN